MHCVFFAVGPVVEVVLAPALDPTNIREGEDVYFECHIKANPSETRVVWLHEVRETEVKDEWRGRGEKIQQERRMRGMDRSRGEGKEKGNGY